MSAKYRGSMLAAAAMLLVGTGSAWAVDKVICVPWEGDPAKAHTAIAGTATQLTCVVKTDSTAPRYYKWSFGDGSADSTILTLSGGTKYEVDTTHVYNAAVGTPFTAQLQVSTNSVVQNPVAGTYRLKIEDNQGTYNNNSLDARINIAIDKGLWWLYKHPSNGGSTYDGSAFMSWNDNYGVYASPTASTVQAFAINNHKIKGDPNIDPYAEAVQLGMNFIIKGRQGLVGVTLGDTFGNNNGYGIKTVGAYQDMYSYNRQHQVYEGGQVMDAIIASGVLPTDFTGRDFAGRAPADPNYHQWTYKEVLQDMADMYSYYQHSSGAWAEWDFTYGENDNSSSQWAAIGYIPALAPPWNIVVPDIVKTRMATWLTSSYCASGNTGYMSGSYFGYQGACGSYNDNAFNTTPSGMVMMSMVGQIGYDDPATPGDERNPKWIGAEKFMADNWTTFLNTPSAHWDWRHGDLRSYGFYAMAKAMRLSQPKAVERITKSDGTSFDWYRGDSANKGMAQRLVETQAGYGTGTGGSWEGELTTTPLTTAWMTIILKPALFASSPTACFTANPNPTYSNAEVSFDPSCSGHSETGKTIANLTKFEWDWNNDGTFDTSSATPATQAQKFICPNPPCTFPVKLKVSDDADPPLTATAVVDVKITNPPHPPVANAGGPYVASLCTADTLILDGSKSFHPDQGLFEGGCENCPGDQITTYSWDLMEPLTFDSISASTAAPTTKVTVAPANFLSLSSTSLALKVTDNSRLAFPNSGNATNLSGTAFGTVDVKRGCLCTITARAKTGMVQLSWAATEHTASTSYDIYRSTDGPNTGFTKIRSGYTNAYPVFVDTGLANGTTYYYRVEAATAGAPACRSKAVWAKPAAL